MLQIGLLGKANVGKSTFFSAATSTDVPSGNFPFTTIEPNVGVAYARTECACRGLGVSHETPLCSGGTRLVPVKLIDVAGLVPGAHEGRGLGNKFLDDARQADALIHVVDASGGTDIQGQPVQAGSHDPLEDIAFVEEEFDLWFADILERDWDKISREVEQRRSKLAEGISGRFSGLGIGEEAVLAALQKTGLGARPPKEWDAGDRRMLARELRADSRPMVIAANKADACADLGVLDSMDGAVACSAEVELLLQKASRAGAVRYEAGGGSFEAADGLPAPQARALDAARAALARTGSTGVQEVINRVVFGSLGGLVVYPVEDEARLANKDGDVLPDAKLVRSGSTARDLAGMVHADIADGFLHAIDCRTKQRIGGDHMLRDGDVIKIVSTRGRG